MSQLLDWQCFSVQDFFTHHNWSGKKPPQTLELKPDIEATIPLNILEIETSSKSVVNIASTGTKIETDLKTKVHTATPVSISRKPISWKCLTVEDFFTQNNWSGRPKELNFQAVIDLASLGIEDLVIAEDEESNLTKLPEITPDNISQFSTKTVPNSLSPSVIPTPVKASGFSLILSVKDFCEAIEWEGQPEIAVLPQIKSKKPISELTDEFTLDDLSDLF